VDNGKKFFVVNVPVSLGHVKSSGKESDGMELAFLIPLLKDHSHHVGRGIAVHDEGVLKLRLSEYGGSADGVFQGYKGLFMFIVPIKLPSPCAVGYQRIERCGQDAKPVDIHPVKVEEAEECPNFLQRRGSLPISHTLDFHWVHGNRVFTDDHAKVFHLVDLEDTFLGFQVEIVLCEDAQNIVNNSRV
jgi:hypothetical protein